MFTPFLCLVLALTDPSGAEMETRSFPLGPALESDLGSPSLISLTPLRPSFDFSLDDGPLDPDENLTASYLDHDLLTDMVVSNIQPEQWEYEGRTVEIVDDTLVITAPTAVLDEVGTFLNAYSKNARRTVGVTLSLVGVSSDVQLSGDIHLELPVGQIVHYRKGVTKNYLRTYSPEIAQASTVQNPELDQIDLGVTADLLAFADGDRGALISYVIQMSWLEELTEEALGLGMRLSLEKGNYAMIRNDAVIQKPRVAFATIAGTVYLETRESAQVHVMSPHAKGEGVYGLAKIALDSISPASNQLAHNLYMADLGVVGSEGLAFHPLVEGSLNYRPWAGDDPAPMAGAFQLSSRALEHVLVTVSDRTLDSDIAIRLADPDKRIFIAQDMAGEQLTMTLLTDLMNSSVESLRDHKILISGEKADKDPIVVLRADRGQAFALCGFQQTFVSDYEVEVANSASISDPIVTAAIDGIAIWARPLSTPDLPEAMAVSVFTHVLEDANTSFDTRSDTLGVLDLPSYQVEMRDARVSPGSPAKPVGSAALADGEISVSLDG